MAMMDTTNATTIPKIRIMSSLAVKWKPNLISFKRLAPAMIGMLIKKENSVATVREVPTSIPPMMVEPEREVPGMRESTWKQPILKAVIGDMSSKLLTVGV